MILFEKKGAEFVHYKLYTYILRASVDMMMMVMMIGFCLRAKCYYTAYAMGRGGGYNAFS